MSDEKQIFRKKNIERINSPESLDQYLKVTSPGVWILLIAIIVLLCGAIVWGCLGYINVTAPTVIVSDGNAASCYVTEDAVEATIKNQELIVDNKTYKITPNGVTPSIVTDETSAFIFKTLKLQVGDTVYELKLADHIDKGIYQGTIITETIKPISFLLN